MTPPALLLLAVLAPDVHATETVRVAAIQFGGGPVAGCTHGADNCAIEKLVRQAAAAGARLVVTPEYALDQEGREGTPPVGEALPNPTQTPVMARFSALAAELGLYLVINLQTAEGGHPYNSQVAFGPEGRVVATHHKFELYDFERQSLTAGTDVSAFDTPFGRVGLLICADIYGDPALHERLIGELGATIIAFSTRWTVAGAPRWPSAFARDWGVTVVAANGSRGVGRGGGVFAPDGEALASGVGPVVTTAEVVAGPITTPAAEASPSPSPEPAGSHTDP